ncbi:S8/S53 family peptidase [Ruminiclostridium cellobioparum]|uniref:Subtilase family n=1 Tax=Ruminiclostridium cellobioparum subsp. termitidis CT1112 TaxID=1195236 RepID=S0FIW5_RUMCE|nr:S8/S53 family peptidase [Ruminiclostridium cellobioparum]EMS70151.1 Subtilase family [Ruminiclostridium cellobioparum subsp. termitidis CT1112]
MKRFFRAIISTVLIAVLLFSPYQTAINAEGNNIVYKTLLSPKNKLCIVTKPLAADFSSIHPGKMTELPGYNEDSDQMWQVDLRSSDLTLLDLKGRLRDLTFSSFDSKTRWPGKLPEDFNPQKIMDLGKNPGLGVRALHRKGINGKGIGIAIIDQTLLVDHVEYKNRLKMYEEIHNPGDVAAMHGPAVASIAVGKSAGVAPEADLYYIAETHGTFGENDSFDWDLTWLAKSIDRIVEVNKILPKNKKIRVISISLEIGSWFNGYEKALAAIDKAKKEGIYTVYVGSYNFTGLGRDPLKSADDVNSYSIGLFLKKYPYKNEQILIPMDSRCTASPTGPKDYVFYREGGMSWTVPYVAGLYALACQVNSEITPEAFWKEAEKTCGINKDKLGKIINPSKLLDNIKRLKNSK